MAVQANAARTRRASEARLKRAAKKRARLETQLEETRAELIEAVLEADRLGTPKTRISFLADLDRSRIYQLLQSRGQQPYDQERQG